MYTSFLEVARADWAAALVMVPLFFAFAVQTMRIAAGDARQRCALFPESRFLAAVDQKRAGQIISLEQFGAVHGRGAAKGSFGGGRGPCFFAG